MASKKKVARRGLTKVQATRIVYGLSRRAESEVDRLLKRTKAGTITKSQLDTRLQEVHGRLERMLELINKII